MNHSDIIDHIRQQKLLINDELNSLDTKMINEKKIAEIQSKIDEMKKLIHQYSMTMIAYDLRCCNEIVKELESQLKTYRTANKPLKLFKFSFDIHKKSNHSDSNSQNDEIDTSTQMKSDKLIVNFDWPGFRNRKNEMLSMHNSQDKIDGKDIILESLDNCQVQIFGAPSSIRIISLRNCQIYTGPIRTSAFIDDCQGCKFEIIAQQARIHNSRECDFYFHIISRIIIENSTQLRFGKYKWTYEQLIDDCQRSGMDLSCENNNWNCIDDFDCVQSPSPNWSLIKD